MAVDRLNWYDLPRTTRHAVEQHTGPVRSARTVSAGQNSAVAALLTTQAGTVFVKGLHRDYPRRWNQDMEAMINPHITHLAPRLLWRVQDEWDLLGFEAIRGHHASYQPGSPDLPKVVEAAAELGSIACPDLPVKRAEHRWRDYVTDPSQLRMLAGQPAPAHRLQPAQRPHQGRPGGPHRLGMAHPRAGWIDPACLILRLIAHGHTIQSAETVVCDLPAWQTAPAEGIAIFAQACGRMWHEIASANPISWTQHMAEASDKNGQRPAPSLDNGRARRAARQRG